MKLTAGAATNQPNETLMTPLHLLQSTALAMLPLADFLH